MYSLITSFHFFLSEAFSFQSSVLLLYNSSNVLSFHIFLGFLFFVLVFATVSFHILSMYPKYLISCVLITVVIFGFLHNSSSSFYSLNSLFLPPHILVYFSPTFVKGLFLIVLVPTCHLHI